MNSFAQKSKFKIRLKYKVLPDYTPTMYAFPIHIWATIDISDINSRNTYNKWMYHTKLGSLSKDNKSCHIHIGIRRG